jgi:predicted nuclease of predicted toxin-antitoxin system
VTRRDRPRQRFLFDELLPWKVASALHVLGFRTSHVGHVEHGQPPRGSSDKDVLVHAMKTSQIVVTYNHDMILLCAEQGQPVVWIDPRGRQYRHDELVLLAFKGMAKWEAMLASASGPMCLKVLRTKVDLLPLDRAGVIAERRMKAMQAKNTARKRRPPQTLGQLATE